MKNDRKIVFILLGFELVLLSVLMLVAVLRVGKDVTLPDAPVLSSGSIFEDSI